jgi:hypothetical protein
MYPSAPPIYNPDMQVNQQQYRESMPNYNTTVEDRMANFQQLVDRYESELLILEMSILDISKYLVNHTFATKLRALEGYEIVFICDDSGSMNTPLGN